MNYLSEGMKTFLETENQKIFILNVKQKSGIPELLIYIYRYYSGFFLGFFYLHPHSSDHSEV